MLTAWSVKAELKGMRAGGARGNALQAVGLCCKGACANREGTCTCAKATCGTQGAVTWVRCSSLPRWASPLRSCHTETWLQGVLPAADPGCSASTTTGCYEPDASFHASSCLATPAVMVLPVKCSAFCS